MPLFGILIMGIITLVVFAMVIESVIQNRYTSEG